MRQEEKIWIEALSLLRRSLGEDTHNRWMRPAIPLALDGNVLRIGVSDDFCAGWLRNHYLGDVEAAAAKVSGIKISVVFEPGHLPSEAARQTEADHHHASTPAPASASAQTPAPAVDFSKAPNCNSRFNFDSFVVGGGNSFAFAAAKAVSDDPGRQFNPLFIYSGCGLGKTHLLHAIANNFVAKRKRNVVEYQTCEGFMNHYVDAIENKRLSQFRQRFRKIDMLLIDDIHFLSGKVGLQEEFFNTFNSLHNNEKQIVLTSDRPPAEINGIESRLVSRFEHGLTVDIQSPDLETRLAILHKKQDEHAVKLDDAILYFIAARISSNIRKLEGALLRLTAFSSISGVQVDIAAAEKLLRSDLMQEESARISINLIIRQVAEACDVRVSELLGKKRPKNIAMPRMMAMFLARELTDCSLSEIGDAFGGRDHATVISAVKRVKGERVKDKRVDNILSNILRQLQGNPNA